MRRRDVIWLISGAATWPLAAQQRALPIIVFSAPGPPGTPAGLLRSDAGLSGSGRDRGSRARDHASAPQLIETRFRIVDKLNC